MKLATWELYLYEGYQSGSQELMCKTRLREKILNYNNCEHGAEENICIHDEKLGNEVFH
jgi:hypothetical protein